MSDNVNDLLADLDAEFGKKPRGRPSKEPEHKGLNKAFHTANPRSEFAKGQIDSLRFENYYDWERHKQAVIDGNLEQLQGLGEPSLQWIPEACITYVVRQVCACCKNATSFVGREYIRFRGRRRKYRDINGVEHETYSTMLKPVAEVDGNILSFGIPPDGDPLPDLVEHLDETVRRCASCIELEQQALDLFIRVVQPQNQLELDIDIPLSPEGL